MLFLLTALSLPFVLGMLSTADLAKRFSVSKPTIFRWRESGTFPAPLVLGKGTVRWREKDIALFEAWLLARAEAEQDGKDPNKVPQPSYSLPISNDAYQMARERLAAVCEMPSENDTTVEGKAARLEYELQLLVGEAAIIASSQPSGVLPEGQVAQLQKYMTDSTRDVLLEVLPAPNAQRLREILST